MSDHSYEVAVIGTGIIGISTAYYLSKNHGISKIVLIDRDQPMAFTSAQSGENYRNWWPHPSMVNFTNRGIDLLEEIALAGNNSINMNRRGYALVTRSIDIQGLLGELHKGLGESAERMLRFHDAQNSSCYEPAHDPDWQGAPEGVDILSGQPLIRQQFPSYADDARNVIHIRRGGDISGQQLGMFMLEHLKENGVQRMLGDVKGIEQPDDFSISLVTADGTKVVRAGKIVNAAGPFAAGIAKMIGVELPLYNTFQQKIAFEDRERAIPRNIPFTIDLDNQQINWSDEERELLLDDPEYRWLAEDMPGAIHCRPDGGDNGTWIRLGWAFNEIPAEATWEPPLDDNFPDIVLRGASRLHPSLKTYFGQLPRNMHHYGGWYTMTEENWPLIGSMGPEGAFMNCAYSGFGTMAATVGGELCAAAVVGADLPDYAPQFSLARRDDATLMKTLLDGAKGVL